MSAGGAEVDGTDADVAGSAGAGSAGEGTAGAGTGGEDVAHRAWQSMRDRVLAYDRRALVAEALGMSFVRVKALRHVADGGADGVPMHQLTSVVAVDKAYTTLIVDDLEARGLVVRTPNPADRRSKLVTATPDGEKEAARAEAMLDEPPPELLALDPADQAELLRLLDLITPADR